MLEPGRACSDAEAEEAPAATAPGNGTPFPHLNTFWGTKVLSALSGGKGKKIIIIGEHLVGEKDGLNASVFGV